MNDEELVAKLRSAARRAASRAYCPYSGFRVGAAAMSASGEFFLAANMENASYGLTICAERNAVFQLKSAGGGTVSAIAIYTPTISPTAPCGACRQVMRELAPDATVYCFCDSGKTLQRSVSELLPDAFDPSALETMIGRNYMVPVSAKPRLCVDIDNVVAQTDEVMRRVISEVTSGRVSLEYEDVRTFNYWECQDKAGHSITREEWNAVHDRFSDPDVLCRIRPYPDVQNVLNRLSDKFVIHFATSRLPKARSSTIDWLDRNGFPEHDIHFLKHGEKHISLGSFDVSVEDDPEQAMAFAAAGFGRSFVVSHPWNAHLVNTDQLQRISGWDEIANILIHG